MNTDPFQSLQKLEQEKIYQDWKKKHQESFLSHYFCQINSEFLCLSEWEIGFYDQSENKITVFIPTEKSFQLKVDDVFKQEQTVVEKLELNNLKVNLPKAISIFKDNLTDYFPEQKIGNGFLILQQLNEQILWNFTFITKTLKFINLKINAIDGEVIAHETIDLVEKN